MKCGYAVIIVPVKVVRLKSNSVKATKFPWLKSNSVKATKFPLLLNPIKTESLVIYNFRARKSPCPLFSCIIFKNSHAFRNNQT